MKVTFKISMDAEQKKLDNVKEVAFEVDFNGVDADVIQKHAIANCIVQWQGQIRTHWTEFMEKGLPATVVFGTPLFASKVRTITRPVTVDDVKNALSGMTLEEKLAFLGIDAQGNPLDLEGQE